MSILYFYRFENVKLDNAKIIAHNFEPKLEKLRKSVETEYTGSSIFRLLLIIIL